MAVGFAHSMCLMVATIALLNSGRSVCIIDADAHYGDGTVVILDRLDLNDQVLPWTYGRTIPTAEEMFEEMNLLRAGIRDPSRAVSGRRSPART